MELQIKVWIADAGCTACISRHAVLHSVLWFSMLNPLEFVSPVSICADNCGFVFPC